MFSYKTFSKQHLKIMPCSFSRQQAVELTAYGIIIVYFSINLLFKEGKKLFLCFYN
jgi:hypothetical protein